MAINSVSPSIGTLSQSVRPQQQADQAKQAEQAEERAKARQQVEEPKKSNKHVVNTLGQKTGTVVNTTA